MGSTTQIWFHIVNTFTRVDELCEQALVAEMAKHRTQAEQQMIRDAGQGRSFGQASDEKAVQALAHPRYPRAADLAKDLSTREKYPDGANLVQMRDGMRRHLQDLKKELMKTLVEHDVHYVLMPITIYCDELARAVTRGAVDRWEPLQSELYNMQNGGERFYDLIEDRFKQEGTPPIVFEVFYFCLNDGFVGKFQGDPAKIQDYKDRLNINSRIPKMEKVSGGRKEAKAPLIVGFPWKYYAIAAGVIIGVYLLLNWVATNLSS
jgi:type IV/VI secretion system ImpK/VasF family protein